MVDDLNFKDLNTVICILMKTYTSGEFTITKEMLLEHNPNDSIVVSTNFVRNTYELKYKKDGGTNDK